MKDADVNGPVTPSATTHASASYRLTVRTPSWRKLCKVPLMMRLSAKASPAATTAMMNRRRRHWRSRRVKNHMSVPPSRRDRCCRAERSEHRVEIALRRQWCFFHVRDLHHQVEGGVELRTAQRRAVGVGDLRRTEAADRIHRAGEAARIEPLMPRAHHALELQ